MLYNYIRMAYRNLSKQRFYTALNLVGLSLGIAGGLLLFQFIRYHLSFDAYHPKAGQLYRVVTQLNLEDKSVVYEPGTPLALTETLQREASQVKAQGVLQKLPAVTIGVGGGGQPKFFSETNTAGYTDGHWFELFGYTWIKGDAASALKMPNTAVITNRLAHKYFGNEEAMGRTIRLNDQFPLTITGVLEDYPPTTDLQTELFISRASWAAIAPGVEQQMLQQWGAINTPTQSFVWIPDVTALISVEKTMHRLKVQHFDKSIESAFEFHLQPLKDIHFDSRYGGTMQRSLLVTLGIVGLFLVLTACFNFINLATAQSARRAREVGTRKVLGGSSAAIFWQFMTETMCMVLASAFLSLLWVQPAQPLTQRWLQTDLRFNILHDRILFLFLLGLTAVVTMLAGAYPALVLSRWKPVTALKSKVSDTRSVLFRKVLIVVQHVVVQVLIICTIIITLQTKYMKDANPGFNKDAVLMVPVTVGEKNQQSLLEERLRQVPGVQSVSFCFQAPLSDASMGGSINYDDRAWEDFPARTIMGDTNYLHTFQLQLLAGRNILPSDTVREVLINETLAHKFGFKDVHEVLGHRVHVGQLDDHPAFIAGVVKDFNTHPLYEEMKPTLIVTWQKRYRYAAIKLSGRQDVQVRENIQKIWQGVYPANVFEYHYLNEQMDQYYHKEDLLNKLINTTAIIAIIISCLGLTGLIAFFALQRTKEIGIRKVLGATVPGIVFLLSKDFLFMVAGAMLVAVPLAWWYMHGWLQDFAYHISVSWWTFAFAGALSAIIALVTVSYQAVRAARANPADSLRSE